MNALVAAENSFLEQGGQHGDPAPRLRGMKGEPRDDIAPIVYLGNPGRSISYVVTQRRKLRTADRSAALLPLSENAIKHLKITAPGHRNGNVTIGIRDEYIGWFYQRRTYSNGHAHRGVGCAQIPDARRAAPEVLEHLAGRLNAPLVNDPRVTRSHANTRSDKCAFTSNIFLVCRIYSRPFVADDESCVEEVDGDNSVRRDITGGGSPSNQESSDPSVTLQFLPVPSAATKAANRRAGVGGHSP